MATEPSSRHRKSDASIRRAETELYERLKATGFDQAGEAWVKLRSALIEYAYSQLVQALRAPGAAYRMARNHGNGVGVRGLAKLPPHLVLDDDDARTLATLVLAKALPPFHSALKDGRWSPSGTARLTTFFFGRCLMELPDRYQHLIGCRPSHTVLELTDDSHGPNALRLHSCDPDPAERATMAAFTDALLAKTARDVRAMFELQVAGYTYAEIASMFTRAGTPCTEAAIRTALYRARQEVKQ